MFDFSTLAGDVRTAARKLTRARPSAWAVLLTFMVVCAVNSVVAALLVAVERGSLRLPNPETLILVWQHSSNKADSPTGGEREPIPETVIRHWTGASNSLSGVAYHRPWQAQVRDDFGLTRIRVRLVSHSFFETLGIKPWLGAIPSESERFERSVAVSFPFWRTHLRGRQGIIGQSLEVDGRSFEIAAVLPESFRDPLADGRNAPLLYLPHTLISRPPLGVQEFHVVARRRAGFTGLSVLSDLQRLADELSGGAGGGSRSRVELSSLRATASREIRPRIIVLLAATVAALALAVVAVLMLLLSRASSELQTLAIRSATGATPLRVLRPLMFEAALMLLISTAGALPMAGLVVWQLRMTSGESPEYWLESLDWTFIAAAIVLTAGTVFVVFVAGALAAITRLPVQALLRSGTNWRSKGVLRLQHAASIAQIALTVIMLSHFLGFLKQWASLREVDLGFRGSGMAITHLSWPIESGAAVRSRLTADRLLESLQSEASAADVAITNTAPLDFNATTTVTLRLRGGGSCSAGLRLVSRNYFRVTGVTFVVGGGFDDFARPARNAAVVNELFVRRCLNGAVHVRDIIPFGEAGIVVAGVIRDVRTFGRIGFPEPEIYMEMDRLPEYQVDILFRPGTDLSAPFAGIRRAAASLGPQFSLTAPTSMDKTINEELAPLAVLSTVMGVLSAMMGCTSMVGTYWALTNSLQMRRQEYALKSAIGATPNRLLQEALWSGLAATAKLGLPVGMAATAILGPWVPLLVENAPKPGATEILLAAVAVALTTALAGIVPSLGARRTAPAAVAEWRS
jgi:hypothetical protein